MTLPLTYTPIMGMGIELRMIDIAGGLALLGYNLRKRYATALNTNGPGSISMGANNIGSATNTERQVGSSTNPHHYVGATAPTITRQGYTYRQNLAGLPVTNPADFTDSYAQYDVIGNVDPLTGLGGTGQFRQETNIENIYSNIVSPCINEMINGDEIGTYRVSVNAPAGGTWIDKSTFFRDSVFVNAQPVVYRLWLKMDDTAPAVNPQILKVEPAGSFRLQDSTVLEDILYPILVNALNRSTLRYTVGTSVPTVNRGAMLDRQLTIVNVQTMPNRDDYRTTASPTGPLLTATTYYLGLS